MSDSLLYDSAVTWKKLCSYTYHLTYGFKKKLHDVTITFDPRDFPHLAGFHYLYDIALPRYSSAKQLERILEGKITQAQIEKAIEYEELVKPRLLALRSLDQVLDSDFTLYSFVPRFAPFTTQLQADYLIESQLNGISFVFLVRSRKKDTVSDCTCISTFTKAERDFAKNQRPYEFLKKTRRSLEQNTETVLFTRPGFEESKGVDPIILR